MAATIAPDTLRNLRLFSGLTEQERENLIRDGQIQQCPKGKLLFTYGDPIKHFYIILNGTFQLFRTNPDGHEKTIELLKNGQPMCEGEILDSCRTHRINAMPVEDSAVLEFPASWLKESAKKYATFALNLLSLISQQAHLAKVEAEHQATMSAAQLVACFMQRLCVLYNFNPSSFELPYSKTLIASRLGMELETFSRTLAKLRKQGLVVDGSTVRIHDLKRIEHYVCSFCSVAEDCMTHNEIQKKYKALH